MLLKKLTDARGVSGDEGEIRTLLKGLCEERGAACKIDRMGNLIATKDGGDASAPHILLDAHMDEIGLIVSHVCDDGLLKYKTVGGIDSRVVVSKRVLLGDKKIPGVIGAKAIHLQTAADMASVLQHNQMRIDIGAKSRSEAMELCPPGTYATFATELTEFGDGLVISRCLDDRVGCYAMLKALEHGYRGKLTCAFTVQEEVGLRGAIVASHYLDNDLAISLESTSANDLGDVPGPAHVCEVGGGIVLSHMDRASIAHPGLRAAIEAIAMESGIPCQPKRGASGGNNAGAYQRGTIAKPTAVLSVPCRYIHSPNSVASKADIQAQVDLVCATLDKLPAKWADINA